MQIKPLFLCVSCWLLASIFNSHTTFAFDNHLSLHSERANQLATSSTSNKKSAPLTLKKIMASADWIGNSPTAPQWSLDGSHILYAQKAIAHQHQNHFKIDIKDKKVTELTEQQSLYFASQQASKNQAGDHGVFSYQGDLYLIQVKTGEIKRLTADERIQSEPRFVNNQVFSFFEAQSIFLFDIKAGIARQIANFKTEKDPQQKTPQSYLEQSQPRLFEVIKSTLAEDKFQQQREQKISQSNNHDWYLGDHVSIETFRLSPDANWLILGTVENDAQGKPDNMPEFVTANGYVKNTEVRSLVGTDKPLNETLYLVDLVKHQKFEIDVNNLPGINDDPLDKIKKSAAEKIGYKYIKQQGPRAIYVYEDLDNKGVAWSDNSGQVAINLFSFDNKDRWIIGIDVNAKKVNTLNWLSDEAWINDWTFNEFGWLPDSDTLYYLSEEDGYSHLYIKDGKRRARQLTEGEFEVSDITVSKSGSHIYFRANKNHPGNYEIYRLAVANGTIETLTELGGVNDYVLSPDEGKLLISHSTTTQMPELYLKANNSKAKAIKLTDTMSEAFKTVNWQAPKIIQVPSSDVERPIYGRYYPSRNESKKGDNQLKPAVIFVHGAGYLQNAHQGWSGYFREFMFHNMLTEQGYTVLDLDYRASKGYGRDWRTAIYRQMGTPELADLKDGVNWLVKNAKVDPKRVGVYGGSYGGFMTFMAMFKAPELFAAGAALRPVTDWAHYNHGYTANMLNTPEVDPDAYERSSPIEFAQNLAKPLLIAHGMVDDNVFFKDSVRLVQRLIELEKTRYFETAIYPVEPHGFIHPSSWLDEYTRILRLFEQYLN